MADEIIEQVFTASIKVKPGSPEPPEFRFQPSGNMSPHDAIMLLSQAIQWCVAQQLQIQAAEPKERGRIVVPKSIIDTSGRIIQ